MVFWPCEGSWAQSCAGCESWQAKSRLGARKSSLGYGPQARSVLHCHGVLALRGGPWPGGVQDVKVGRQSQGLELEKARFEASF